MSWKCDKVEDNPLRPARSEEEYLLHQAVRQRGRVPKASATPPDSPALEGGSAGPGPTTESSEDLDVGRQD